MSQNPTRQPAHEKQLRGSNQSGMRAYNQRLILSLVRRRGALSKTELSRLTGLSLQTVSVIMRALEAEGLLQKGAPVRGKVGQPSVPMSLRPQGAYFLGLKIGRRSADMVLIDFVGTILAARSETYHFPTPSGILDFCRRVIGELTALVPAHDRHRIKGLGVALPGQLWNWAQFIGAPAQDMQAWRDGDFQVSLDRVSPFAVTFENDATAACCAEVTFGAGADHANFLYIFIGYFVGGGVVLNGQIYPGPLKNAGSLGSLPVPNGMGGTQQLIMCASVATLERRLKAAGRAADMLRALPDVGIRDWSGDALWMGDPKVLDAWIFEASQSLAHAITCAVSVIDFPTVMIDGWLPDHVRAGITERTRSLLAAQNLMGLETPQVISGTIGHTARALGAAGLPLMEHFLVNDRVFRKGAVKNQ